jgi:arginase family enzyme
MTMQMTRRSFAGICAALPAMAAQPREMLSMLEQRVYDVFGVPLRTGSLYPGNENDALAFREAGIMEQFERARINAVDRGNIPIPSFLPHHSIAPVRNWPGPRIVWDCASEHIGASLKQQGHVPLLIGCDCSIVVGTAQALMRAGSRNVHVLYFDGDFDDAAPQAHVCNSAASFATWFLTNSSPFWAGPVLNPSQVTVVGWSVPSKSPGEPVASVSLAEIRKTGIGPCVKRLLDRIPSSADILLHLDIDVLTKEEMPAAYFPHKEGLSLSECAELLRPIVNDRRVRLIEVSEYAALRDFERTHVRALLTLLTESLTPASV